MVKDRAEHILIETVKRLKELRKQHRLSHDMLAKKAGITRPAVSHIENGRRKPSLLICLRLAHAMDADLSDIIKSIEKALPKN